jgi:hypothetical protein
MVASSAAQQKIQKDSGTTKGGLALILGQQPPYSALETVSLHRGSASQHLARRCSPALHQRIAANRTVAASVYPMSSQPLSAYHCWYFRCQRPPGLSVLSPATVTHGVAGLLGPGDFDSDSSPTMGPPWKSCSLIHFCGFVAAVCCMEARSVHGRRCVVETNALSLTSLDAFVAVKSLLYGALRRHHGAVARCFADVTLDGEDVPRISLCLLL